MLDGTSLHNDLPTICASWPTFGSAYISHLAPAAIFFQLKIWPNFGWFESLPSNLHFTHFFFQIIAPFHRVSLPICFGDLHHDPPIRKQFRCFKVLLEVVEGSPTGAHQLWRTLHLFSPIHHRTHAAHGSGFTRGSHLKAWRWPLGWSPMAIWSDVEVLFFEDKHVIEIRFFGSFGEGHWSGYFSLLRFFWTKKPILDEGNSFLRSCWLGLVRFGRDFVDQSGD